MKVSEYNHINSISHTIHHIKSIIYSIFINNKNYNIKEFYIKQTLPDVVFEETHYIFHLHIGRTVPDIYRERRPSLKCPKKYFYECLVNLIREHTINIHATQDGSQKINRSLLNYFDDYDGINTFIKERLYMRERINITLGDSCIDFLYKSYLNVNEYIIVHNDSNEICRIYDLFKEYVYVKAMKHSTLNTPVIAIISNEMPPPANGKWHGISRYINNMVIKGDINKVVECTSTIPFEIRANYNPI